MSYTICSPFKGEHIVYAGYTICTSREHIVYGAFCGSTWPIVECELGTFVIFQGIWTRNYNQATSIILPWNISIYWKHKIESIISIQVHVKKHEKLFISTCSFLWINESGWEFVLKSLWWKTHLLKWHTVVGTHWNGLIEATPMCTYNRCVPTTYINIKYHMTWKQEVLVLFVDNVVLENSKLNKICLLWKWSLVVLLRFEERKLVSI